MTAIKTNFRRILRYLLVRKKPENLQLFVVPRNKEFCISDASKLHRLSSENWKINHDLRGDHI